MTTPVSAPEQAPSPGGGAHRMMWIGAGLAVALLAVAALAVGFGRWAFHGDEGRPLPAFPSLAEHPDPALQGTVAYYASDTGCVRIVAAAGRPSKDLWCLPPESASTWAKLGKPAGPQLVWRADGRLEVTMFRWLAVPGQKSAPPLVPGWQKVIDVRTGAVQNVPAAEVPASPSTTSQPRVSPRGERLSTMFDASTGRVLVTLTDATGTRTLLSAHGPGEYGYRFDAAFWAPNWQWAAASDDGRILVITTGRPALTRVLVTGTGGGAGGGEAGPAFAVTAANLLAP